MSLTFSQRMGFTPIKDIIQTHDMDSDLRNGLWNAFFKNIWRTIPHELCLNDWGSPEDELVLWGSTFWLDFTERYLKHPIDEATFFFSDCSTKVKGYFLSSDWSEVYNFIEFLYTCTTLEHCIKSFIQDCNQVLERELSGYRIVDGIVTPITNSIEVASLEAAIESRYEYANQHLHSAIKKLSDRDNPDYRNSIKESISAVEAICRKLTGESTLDRALNKIGNKIDFNSQFKQGLEKLYHYTNGEGGIRHALIDEGQSSFDEAKFMLVACSAFVNYLTAKASVLND